MVWIALVKEKGKEVTFEQPGIVQKKRLCRLQDL
jgi:hypothetical protein